MMTTLLPVLIEPSSLLASSTSNPNPSTGTCSSTSSVLQPDCAKEHELCAITKQASNCIKNNVDSYQVHSLARNIKTINKKKQPYEQEQQQQDIYEGRHVIDDGKGEAIEIVPVDDDLLIPSLAVGIEDETVRYLPLHHNCTSSSSEDEERLYNSTYHYSTTGTMARRRVSNKRHLFQSSQNTQQEQHGKVMLIKQKQDSATTMYQSPKTKTQQQQQQQSFITTFITPTGPRYGAMNSFHSASSNNSTTSNTSTGSGIKEKISDDDDDNYNNNSKDWKQRFMLFSTPPKRNGGIGRTASTPTTTIEYFCAGIASGNDKNNMASNVHFATHDRNDKYSHNNTTQMDTDTSSNIDRQVQPTATANATASSNNQNHTPALNNEITRSTNPRNVPNSQKRPDSANRINPTPNTHTVDEFASGVDVEEEDHIIKVVDHVEDEWEEVAYDNLVPLEVRLALERNVFGWSHLSSDIVGHCLFTAGAFSISFVALYLIEQQQKRHRHATNSNGDISDAEYSFFFLCIRWIVSIAAAWSSFRMVRRRRRVWLRAPYGSMKYRMDEARRRLEVEQADNLSWIQRLRAKRGKRKLQKQLKKAENNFIQLYNQRLSRVNAEDAVGNQKYVNNTDGITESYPNDTIASGVLTTPVPTLISNIADDGEQDALVTLDTTIGSKSSIVTSGSWSFRTDSLLVMQSVQQDQIVFRHGPIHRVPYSHGGGFGAAPFMLANTHWISVLRYLMPDVYVELSRRVVSAESHKLLHWAENNPVVAAYSTAHELENFGTITNIEWDVFLDPHLVNRVEIVLQERQKFLLSVLPELPTTRPMETLSDEYMDKMKLSQSQQNVVRYYERQLRKRTQLLVDRMLIAHGNIVHLAVEQTGIWKYYNYSRVKRTRRTLGGGIFARQWVAVYAESLRTGLYNCSQGNTSTNSPTTAHPWAPPQSNNGIRSRSTSPMTSFSPLNTTSSQPTGTIINQSQLTGQQTDQRPNKTQKSTSWLLESTDSICPNTSMAASVAILKHITNRDEPLGLVLDVKSRHVSNQVWACVVDILRESGIRVEGVGSFVMDEIRTLSKFTVNPVRELLFFHSAGDLQQACHNKQIRYGDHVFFNAGCLLWTPRFEHLPTWTTVQNIFSSFNPNQFQSCYRIHPHALPSSVSSPSRLTSSLRQNRTAAYSATSAADGSYHAMSDNNLNEHIARSDFSDTIASFGSTIEDYKKRYNLHIGLYVQEFAIDNVAIDMLVELVNQYPDIYDLGLSWGGINGITLRGIQPGRFTDTSGYWNQRYLGNLWNPELRPPV